MNEQAFKVVTDFNKLPDTDEKLEISRQYLSDEITSFEFYQLASDYLDKVRSATND